MQAVANPGAGADARALFTPVKLKKVAAARGHKFHESSRRDCEQMF